MKSRSQDSCLTSIKVHRFASLLHQVCISIPSNPLFTSHPYTSTHIKVSTTSRLCLISIQVLKFASHFHPVEVSLTRICSKMMEHLDHHKILTDHQFGFWKKISCETQLLITINKLTKLKSLDNEKQIDCILLDFSKAFDKVSHKHHIIKLQHYRVQGPILCWIETFLEARTREVIVKGEHLDIIPPPRMAYGIYRGEMPNLVNHEKVQAQHHHTRLHHPWLFPIQAAQEGKYLDVTLQGKLSFTPHINNNIKMASTTRHFLQRNLRGCSKDVKNTRYWTFVRPLMEYALTVWDPVGNKTSQQNFELEAEQNQCARFVVGDYRRTSSITAIKEQIQWESLTERRAKARATMVYRVINYLVFTPQGFLTPSTVPSQTRGALNKVSIPPHAHTSTTTSLWRHHLFIGMALMLGSQKRRPSGCSGPN